MISLPSLDEPSRQTSPAFGIYISMTEREGDGGVSINCDLVEEVPLGANVAEELSMPRTAI